MSRTGRTTKPASRTVVTYDSATKGVIFATHRAGNADERRHPAIAVVAETLELLGLQHVFTDAVRRAVQGAFEEIGPGDGTGARGPFLRRGDPDRVLLDHNVFPELLGNVDAGESIGDGDVEPVVFEQARLLKPTVSRLLDGKAVGVGVIAHEGTSV